MYVPRDSVALFMRVLGIVKMKTLFTVRACSERPP